MRNILLFMAGICIYLLALGAQAQTNSTSEAQSQNLEQPAPAADKSTSKKGEGNVTLVFQRESGMVVYDAKVFVDGEQYCALASSEECTVMTSAGKHLLKLDARMSTGEYSRSFEFEAHKTYKFAISRRISHDIGALFGVLGSMVDKSINQDEAGSDNGTFTMELAKD
ncbi:hypothetical protein [Polynucleobacter sp. Fuers-14]|jgi:hypothetical protein|uniref:hypothetical protein n=1 Tax=Polynucleobacter sp. Fuers-14 TaxID=1758364 RepID=UPI001C0C9D8D|nr:hypothetical protein [Polynucleobacter sp. Fuers-14]MBU3642211.1 hypothetical protein [Polynucleobacter sp. Fuers-14]